MSRHLNIGAGRIVWQDIVRIDVAIKKREFHKNPAILDSFKRAKEGNGRLHLLGLVRCAILLVWAAVDHTLGLRRWCTLAYQPPVRVAGDGEGSRRAAHVCALLR